MPHTHYNLQFYCKLSMFKLITADNIYNINIFIIKWHYNSNSIVIDGAIKIGLRKNCSVMLIFTIIYCIHMFVLFTFAQNI